MRNEARLDRREERKALPETKEALDAKHNDNKPIKVYNTSDFEGFLAHYGDIIGPSWHSQSIHAGPLSLITWDRQSAIA